MNAMRERLRTFVRSYGHGLWIAGYMLFYMLGFTILESAGHRHYHVIHSVFDDILPFCEYFIIPYFLWFLFMAGGVLWFIFFCKDHNEYYKLTCALAIGMTIFLIVSCVFPNRQDLRPVGFTRSNIFISMVQMLYKTDTPTNVLPSIHVFNTLVLMYALHRNEVVRKHRVVHASCWVLSILIVLSTMFLKQHSVVDVSCGILMSFAAQMFVDRVFAPDTHTQKHYEHGI